MKDKTKSFIGILLVIILFIFFSYIIQNNLGLIKEIIGNNFIGIFFYILITIIAIVIAPISSFPLVSVASNLWGWFYAGVFSIIGWTIGAFIAFIIARTYGISLVKKFIPLQKIYGLEKKIPKENLFLGIIFLRMVIPVDILSYALGLFSKIKTRDYLLATIIGVSPFAFIFAYLGRMPFYYQIFVFLLAIIILSIGLIIKSKK